MNQLSRKSNAELHVLKEQNEVVLAGLIEALELRPEMQEAIRRLMSPDDMLETLLQIGVEDPDTARFTLQACVGAFTNAQSISALDKELKQRAKRN